LIDAAGTTNYHTVMGATTPLSVFGPDTTSPQGAASVAPVGCTASGLRVVLETAPAVAMQFTLQRGATIAALTNAALSCTVAASATSCTSGAATVSIVAGNLIVFRSESAGSIGSDINLFFGWICQ
jgi:hypothetical protein